MMEGSTPDPPVHCGSGLVKEEEIFLPLWPAQKPSRLLKERWNNLSLLHQIKTHLYGIPGGLWLTANVLYSRLA